MFEAFPSRVRANAGSVCDTQAMAGGSVRFTLDDDETLIVPDADVRRIYDLLWELAREPGAVSTAALLIETAREREFLRPKLNLNKPQSAALRHAVTLLHTLDVEASLPRSQCVVETEGSRGRCDGLAPRR